jgi:hypothetical protein
MHTFLDLGFSPPSNAYLTSSSLDSPEKYYPLKIYVCDECWLVQTADYAQAEDLFNSDYAYFSSTSSSWLQHAADYAKKITKQLRLNANSFVVEVASNDGYLLRNFIEAGIPCLGIEPTETTATASEKIGVPNLRRFFGEGLAQELVAQGQQADLVIGNNVYAHVPDINDFTRGMAVVLKPSGTITLEFPHVMRLLEDTLFDTIYHEHFSYLSLTTVARMFAKHGLRVWNVEKLRTHGGSLRVFGCHATDDRQTDSAVEELMKKEISFGLQRIDSYLGFQERVNRIKNSLLSFLIQQSMDGKKVIAYGAAAKGNTLLNYAGVKPDLLPFVCDAAPAKQGKFMPGSHIPIVSPDRLRELTPDYVLILPWNIADEIQADHAYIEEWGGKFVVIGPTLNSSFCNPGFSK